MSNALAAIFLDCSVRRLEMSVSRISRCLEGLSDEQVWMRGSDQENAIGNLVLHLCGNVRQWIIATVGGKPDIRVRDREFSARGDITKQELMERLTAITGEACAVIRSVSEARLAEKVTVQNYTLTVLEAIFHVVEHFALHTGQIIFATKLLTQKDLGFYRHLSNPAGHTEKTP